MSRSTKKGPFVDPKLFKKIEALNTRGAQGSPARPGRATRRSSRRWSGTPSPSTTVAATCRSTSPRTWSATSSASLRRPACSAATPRAARSRPERASESGSTQQAVAQRRPRVTAYRLPSTAYWRKRYGGGRSPRGRARHLSMSAQKVRLVLDTCAASRSAKRWPSCGSCRTRRPAGRQGASGRPPPTPRTTSIWIPTSWSSRAAPPTRRARSSAGARALAAVSTRS